MKKKMKVRGGYTAPAGKTPALPAETSELKPTVDFPRWEELSYGDKTILISLASSFGIEPDDCMVDKNELMFPRKGIATAWAIEIYAAARWMLKRINEERTK